LKSSSKNLWKHWLKIELIAYHCLGCYISKSSPRADWGILSAQCTSLVHAFWPCARCRQSEGQCYMTSGGPQQFGSRYVSGVLSAFSNPVEGCWWRHEEHGNDPFLDQHVLYDQTIKQSRQKRMVSDRGRQTHIQSGFRSGWTFTHMNN